MVIIEKQSDFLTTITICQHSVHTGLADWLGERAKRTTASMLSTTTSLKYTEKDEWFHWICVINSKIMVSRRILLKKKTRPLPLFLLFSSVIFFHAVSPSFAMVFWYVCLSRVFLMLFMKSGVNGLLLYGNVHLLRFIWKL